MPLPTARNAVPIAAVVLPLPGPVLTMMRPRRTSDISEALIVLSAAGFHHPNRSTIGSNTMDSEDWGDERGYRTGSLNFRNSPIANTLNLDDTIVAIATPPGRGGIGVVRLAGPEAHAIALPLLRLKHDLEPGRALFGELVEPGNAHVGTAAPGCPAEQSSAAPTRASAPHSQS